MILFIDKCLRKIASIWRKAVFKRQIGCKHNNFSLVGKVTLINRNIKLGRNVTIYPDCMFFGDGLIQIGDNVDIGNGTIIYASKCGGGVRIGSDTIIAAQCYIIDMDHGLHKDNLIRNQENTVKAISIGEDVWIAAGCKILKGSVIDDGAVIGAQSVVKGEIPENAIAVGVPAKVKKTIE